MTAFLDTNVLVRHLTGDPPDQAAAASRLLAKADQRLLADLILAEIAYVLESVYEAARPEVAVALRAILGFSTIDVIDRDLLHRAVEVYEHDRLGFAEAYLIAAAERSGVAAIVSFDRSIDRVGTIRRIEPT